MLPLVLRKGSLEPATLELSGAADLKPAGAQGILEITISKIAE